ncbi:MAG: hypothetical protein JXA49_04960 [Actinobacteria bacterium]|nr:hypothetical protein [Actinomycetota bacterium]
MKFFSFECVLTKPVRRAAGTALRGGAMAALVGTANTHWQPLSTFCPLSRVPGSRIDA